MANNKYMFKRISFNISTYLFRKIVNSRNAWNIFNHSNVPGFGTNLIRLYFPIYYNTKQHRESFSDSFKKNISDIFDETNPDVYINKIVDILPSYKEIEIKEHSNNLPYLDNYFYTFYDASVLASILIIHKPQRIIEIGSGISTRYMRYFINKFSLKTHITCIDPLPRADITEVANTIIRKPLEDVILNINLSLNKNDIVFMDGSHYVYQGNDTLIFFFQMLPLLPSGVIIHIHDIYLPSDYPVQNAAQLWGEQYILAAMLSAGLKGYKVLFASNYHSKKDNLLKKELCLLDKELSDIRFEKCNFQSEGVSFWMIKE